MMSLVGIALMFASQTPARPPDNANKIRVQIMDSRTHGPLKDRKVQITFSNSDGQSYHNAPSMEGRTDSDGIVIFEVNQPIPPVIGVFVWWARSPLPRLDRS